MMKFIKKLTAGVLITLGMPILIYAVKELSNPLIEPEDREGAEAALIVFGLPLTGVGSWLAWRIYREEQAAKTERDREKGDHLQAIFYQILQQNNGYITILRFAMESQLSGEDAKQFLDQKAKEFNAHFDVTEQGDIKYHFNL